MKDKKITALFFMLMLSFGWMAQPAAVGTKAPDFIVNREVGSIESFLFPHLKKIVYLHFWNEDVITSQQKLRQLNHFVPRYQNAGYRNADGFEVIAVMLTSNVHGWKRIIAEDSLKNVTHCYGPKQFDEQVCKNYGVTTVPTGFLIDENGMIVAVDPSLYDIETYLDEQRNMQPAKKDVTGIMAFTSGKKEVLKFCRVYLFNHYGDSLGKTVTSNTGYFTFDDIKVNQDFTIKLDNKTNIHTTDPAEIYTVRGESVAIGKTKGNGFVFAITPAMAAKLEKRDTTLHSEIQMDVVKTLEFRNDDSQLTPKDEEELALFVRNLQKSKVLKIEMVTHADTKTDAVMAMELTAHQAAALKEFFEKKGVSASRISVIAKGNTDPRKECGKGTNCTPEEHLYNRRVEFRIYKD